VLCNAFFVLDKIPDKTEMIVHGSKRMFPIAFFYQSSNPSVLLDNLFHFVGSFEQMVLIFLDSDRKVIV